MFKKLKDKIAEEVKSSPSRIQQLAQVAQAAVSSASSSTSETVPTNDNFFSITEEDTPQNSPHRPSSTSTPGKSINTTVKNFETNATNNAASSMNNGTILSTRVRKLSSSSMASDVSFRLPTYDPMAPAAFNLQSDLDASASEFEDGGGAMSYGAQLDVISKEKLYDAYKKALDRYQKYRGRYTELVRRYRDLERDNSKARSVLVETQDKALRRINELREQCSLEQQAKAHLESALRLEMDEQDCVIKSLKTKLALLGENPDEVLQNGRESNLINIESNGFDPNTSTDLIDISDGNASDSSRIAAGASIIINESEDKIRNLERQLNEVKEQIAEEKSKLIIRNEEFDALNKKFDESQRKVRELIAREEDNNILLAENKLMIHTELENKEKEVKSLEHRLNQSESDHKQLLTEKNNLNKVLSKFKQEETQISAKLRDLTEDKKRLDAKVTELEKEKSSMESDIRELQAKQIVSESEKQTTLSKHQAEVEKTRVLTGELLAKISDLESSVQDHAKEEIELLQTELNHVKAAHAEVSKNYMKEVEDKLTTSSSEMENAIGMIQQKLFEEQAKVSSLQETIKNQIESISQLTASTEILQSENSKLTALAQQQEAEIQLLTETKVNLTQNIEGLQRQIETSKELEEKIKAMADSLAKEVEAAKTHCSTLKIENDDLHEQIASLTEEIKNIKVVNEKSESEAIEALQTSMKTSINDLNEKLKRLNANNKTLQNQIKNLQKEKSETQSEATTLKNKVEALKNEKRDLEKTLEREIRDKTELKNQVTNILQEIGRLEDELKQVRESHTDIANEKRALEEKTSKLRAAHQEAKAKADKEQKLVLTEKVKEFEVKIKQIECDNLKLAEKNVLLKESNARLQNTVRDLEAGMKLESQQIQELNDQIAALGLELDSSRDENARIQDKLKQSLDVHTELFNVKEQMEQENRSLLDQLEAIEKEKLCLLNTHETLQADLDRSKVHYEQQVTLHEEKNRLTADCDKLRRNLEIIRGENDLLTNSKQQLEQHVDELQSRMKQFDAQQTPLEKEVAELRSRLCEVEHQRTDLIFSLQVSNDERNELIQKVSELEQRLQGIEEVKIENEYLNMSVKQTEIELRAMKKKNEALEKDIAVQKEKQQSQQGECEEDKSKQAVLFQKKNEEIEQLKAICQRSQAFNEELQNELKELKQQFDGMKLINDELHKEISQQQGKYEKLQKDLDEQKKLNLAQEGDLKQEMAKIDVELKNAQSELEQRTSEIADLQSKLDEMEKLQHDALAEKSKKLTEIESKADNLQKEIDSSRAIIGDLNKDLNVQTEKSESIEAQKVQLQSRIVVLQTELDEKTAAPETAEILRRTNEQLQCELAELKRSNERELTDLNHEIDELRSNAKAYHELNNERQHELDHLKSANAALAEQIEQLKGEQVIQVVRVSDTETVSSINGATRDEEMETLRTDKHNMENQLQKILSEVQDVSNRNLFLEQKCENYLILEQSNERLKLQNSKLSQQLDETLVSMQHAEGISANTEFEYLRNIMFQYLTNNINSNGSTLIKVIAAVLKFSPQQTQVVLEKETQRKTVMGQIQNFL